MRETLQPFCRSNTLVLLGLICLLLLLGCGKEIPISNISVEQVVAVFDPANSEIPTPTDIVKNPTTGLLNIPVTKDPEKKAEAYFTSYLNELNGFPQASSATVQFLGELDQSTINNQSIYVLRLYPHKIPEVLNDVVITYKTIKINNQTRAVIEIKPKQGQWERGGQYAIFIVGGKDGLKDKQKRPVVRSLAFEMALSEESLCAWESQKLWNQATGKCEKPTKGEKALGCCTYNYSTLLENAVKKQVRLEVQRLIANEPNESIKKAIPIHAEAGIKNIILEKATDFERMRKAFRELLKVTELLKVKPEDVAVMWSFSVNNMNEAVFDPAGTPPKVPTPTDLTRDEETGRLNIPVSTSASPAEQEFISNLNNLDGFATSSSGSLSFLDEINPSTLTDNIKIFEVQDTLNRPKLIEVKDVKLTYNNLNHTITFTRDAGFSGGTTHVVVAIGGDKGIKNKSPQNGVSPRRSATMHLALSAEPLCDLDTQKKCTKIRVSALGDNLAAATRLEQIRANYQLLLKELLLADRHIKSEDIISFWTFTTTSLTEMLYNPTVGIIPFPNDLLFDPKTNKLNIPSLSTEETPQETALRLGLNTLDGFTTQGPIFIPFSGTDAIDPASITNESVRVFNPTTTQFVKMKIKIEEKGPALVLTPEEPLAEDTRYIVILLSRGKAGEFNATDGLKDKKGRRVIPSQFMTLLRSTYPLYDANTKKSKISLVDNNTAATLEMLRNNYEQLFNSLTLLGLKREDTVAAWTFKTQTITDPMIKLRALPWQIIPIAQLPFDGKLDTTLSGLPANMPKDALGGWVPNGTFQSWLALDENDTGAFKPDVTQGKLQSIPFWLTIPKPQMPSAGIVIFQHSLSRSKADMLAIANTFAKAGLATIGFDAIYHGQRTWCTNDNQCENAGKCDIQQGRCSTALKLTSEGIPTASGSRFFNLNNPFAVRDNFRQHVIDTAALIRALVSHGHTNIEGLTINTSKIFFVGLDLGAMAGTILLATDSTPSHAVLAVPGAPLAEVLFNSPAFLSMKNGLLNTMKIKEGSLAYLRLASLLQTILEPADSGNYARFVSQSQLPDPITSGLVTPKTVLMPLAASDEVIPVSYGNYLAKIMGIDTSKSTFNTNLHGFLLDPNSTVIKAAQAQVLKFLLTGTVCLPNVSDGTCN